MAQTLDTRALNMLLARIVEEEQRRTIALRSAKDFPDLQRRAGFLDAIDHVKELCVQVESDLYAGTPAQKA